MAQGKRTKTADQQGKRWATVRFGSYRSKTSACLFFQARLAVVLWFLRKENVEY